MSNFKFLMVMALVVSTVGCANQKTKQGRQIKVTREENLLSCRYIATVNGTSNDDALAQAATYDLATHLAWTGKGSGKVYSCD